MEYILLTSHGWFVAYGSTKLIYYRYTIEIISLKNYIHIKFVPRLEPLRLQLISYLIVPTFWELTSKNTTQMREQSSFKTIRQIFDRHDAVLLLRSSQKRTLSSDSSPNLFLTPSQKA
jgi:hypothetical protein